MMVVHHEALPESYLLVLAPDRANPSERELAHYLGEACRSGKPAVWIDCRLLDGFSALAARLLRVSSFRLRQHHVRLVLCRVSERLERTLRETFAGPDLCLVDTLDDAAGYPGLGAA